MAFDLEQLMQNPLFQTGLATLGGSAPNRAGLLNAYNAIQNRKKLEMEAQQQAQQMELEKARSELYREQIATSKRKLEQEAKGWEMVERYMGKQGQGVVPQPGMAGQPSTTLAPTAPAQPAASFFGTADSFVKGIEGGFVPNDAGKGPTNEGVNQRANPDIDVKNAPSEVLQQRRRQYWDAIDADKLEPNTAMVAYDSAINQGQGYAKELLSKTGGNPELMLYQRRQDYRALAKSNPLYKQYLPGWEARLDKLAEQVKSGVAQPVAAGPEQLGAEIVPEIQISPTGPRVELKQSYERAKMQQSAQQHQENLRLRQESARLAAEKDRRDAERDRLAAEKAAQELAKPGQEKAQGMQRFNTLIGDLRKSYETLSTGGDIVDPSKGALANIGAGLASSTLGQMGGRIVGTKAQSERNKIVMARPLLMQAIMQATGMNAKQLDSNVELQLYLNAATDPSLDIEANKAALDRLQGLFGGGSTGNVRVTSPDGKTGTIPASQLQDALKQGYKQVQ